MYSNSQILHGLTPAVIPMTHVPLTLNLDHTSLFPMPGIGPASPTIGLVVMLFPLHCMLFHPFLGWLMSSLSSVLHSIVVSSGKPSQSKCNMP